MRGGKRFISFEGIEGSGKSTQVKLLADHLRASGHTVLVTAEPGGTPIGNKIRKLLLEPRNHMDPLTELLLYYAARAQHVREVIYPALLKNSVVITDRFIDSTVAYQGYARGIDLSVISTLDDIVVPDMRPSLTIVLDLEVEEGLRRNREARKEDRFEQETVEFHTRVRQAFHQIAREDSRRVRIVDASRSIDEVSRDVRRIVGELWA